MFSLNMQWAIPSKNKKSKTVLHGFIEIINESKRKQINFGLIKENNFKIALCKNG